MTPQLHMIDIPAGTFQMGSAAGDSDERPVHTVRLAQGFLMSQTPVTNAQYACFRPEHCAMWRQYGMSLEDDEACVFVSHRDALAFCAWLSAKTGDTYRLPTEAEWEYACRAGTDTAFHTGDALPEGWGWAQRDGVDVQPCSLQVGRTAPNAFGLLDMHGLVEEWCLDWYGPYPQEAQEDPCRLAGGSFRVTRGGSVYADPVHLRSARRMAALPMTRNALTGFRVVCGGVAHPVTAEDIRPCCSWSPPPARVVVQSPSNARRPPDAPFFARPLPFVIPPADGITPFFPHNHVPSICALDNGDLLAVWFSTEAEHGREMVILSSRLPAGADAWTPAALFFKVPGRNMSCAALLKSPGGRLYHFNGVGIGSTEENLMLILRVSDDDGESWSEPYPLNGQYTSHKPINQPGFDLEGRILVPCDTYTKHGPHKGMGSVLYRGDPVSGGFEERTGYLRDAEHFLRPGERAGWIAGVHGAVVPLRDGTLLALGRSQCMFDGHTVNGKMPMSLSDDGGQSWRYEASPFPPIGSGQRHALLRLAEGPLVLFSFTDTMWAHRENRAQGMDLIDAQGNVRRGFGLFAALSQDEGKTWPVQRLITPGGPPAYWEIGASSPPVLLDDTHAQPVGYLQAVQTPDGVIQLISSGLHYRFNLPWLLG